MGDMASDEEAERGREGSGGQIGQMSGDLRREHGIGVKAFEFPFRWKQAMHLGGAFHGG